MPLQADADALGATSTPRRCATDFRSPDQSAGRASTVAPTCSDRLGALVGQSRKSSRATISPRPGGFFDHLVPRWRTMGRLRRRSILSELLLHFGPIWPSRLTLGGVPLGDCWRHPALTHGGRDQRARAAAQAFAVAGLFADRAAAMGRHHRDRYRRPDRPRRISQRRAVCRYRRPGVARSGRGDARARRRLAAGRGMARVDRRPARPAGRAMRQQARHGRTTLPLAKVLEGGTWAAGRVSRAKSAPTARRRSRSSATARCSEDIRPEGSHGRRHRRRTSAGPAQADADPRQEHLDQILPRTPQGDRDAAVLRGDPRPAADRGRNRNADGAHDVAAPRRKETGVRADPARRRDFAEGMLDLVPAARVAHIGLYREPESFVASNISSRRRPILPSGSSSSSRR